MRQTGYNLMPTSVAFVAAGIALMAKANLYRLKSQSDQQPRTITPNYEFGEGSMVVPIRQGQVSMAEQAWQGNGDYWLGRYVLTDLLFNIPDKGYIIMNDAVVSLSMSKEIVKTQLVGKKGTIKEYICDGDYSINITVGIVAVNERGEIIDQYPEAGISVVKQMLEMEEAIECNSLFLDLFDINRLVITGFSLQQETYSNRQVIQITALSDSDYNIYSTDY